MSVTVYRKKKARVGSENGRARLSDADIRVIRLLVVVVGLRRRVVAAQYGLSERHVNKLVRGMARLDAGGRVLNAEPEENDLSYDESVVIRCRNCRQKCFASRVDRERCVICAERSGTRNTQAA